MYNKTTMYQNKLNSLTGALGPMNSAYWPDTATTNGPAYTLGAQPLYYSPVYGKYITSASTPAAQGSVSFAFGKKRRVSKRKTRKMSKRKTRKINKKNVIYK
jgi:hypothetical protein